MFRVRAGDHDEKANRISSYPYMIVEQRDQQEQWVDFGAYNYDSGAMHDGHRLGPGKHQRILIELPSNVPQHILQAHRECRTGKKPFCSAGYVGMEPGLALRQDSAGGYYHTECEPSKCALFLNGEEPKSKAKEIFEDWHTTYGYAKLDVSRRENGQMVKAGAACTLSIPTTTAGFSTRRPSSLTSRPAATSTSATGRRSSTRYGLSPAADLQASGST